MVYSGVGSEMHFNILATISFCFGVVLPTSSVVLALFSTFSNVTIFTPPSNYTDPGVLYARTVELQGGVLLSTWENYSPEPPHVYFPIFKSVDGGETWKEIAKVTDQVNGGAAIPNNGIPAIWEPFVLFHEGKIIIYYSDQRDPLYGQKLVHQVSSDLLTWKPLVDDVAYPVYTDRPGMTTVVQLPNEQYMMTYEFGGGPTVTGGDYSFPVYYRTNESPLDFNNSIGYPVITEAGIQPVGSPYITWSPVGGPNGTILVSSGGLSQVFVNQALGAIDAWKSIPTPEGVSYTRHLRVLSNSNHLLIIGGGQLPPSTTNSITKGENMATRFQIGWLRLIPFLGYHHVLMILIAVTIILLSGCSSSSPLIPNIFLISLYYKSYTPVPSTAQTDFNVHTAISNIVGQARLAARVGYFGICINPDGGAWLCSNNATALANEVSVDQDPLNLLWLASQFKDMIVFPYLIIIAIIFAFICLLLLATFPGWHEEDDRDGSEREVKPFPSRPVSQIALAIIFIASIFILVSVLWQHTASVAASIIAQDFGNGSVLSGVGTTAMVLGWFGFALLIVVTIGLLVMILSIRVLSEVFA
ncbi:hypothetical protein B7494_g5853 [Chlorociboria aeruginascens]|nr:hypothetical protein B7494_g5853 [Chlorociboria aeruginascens]